MWQEKSKTYIEDIDLLQKQLSNGEKYNEIQNNSREDWDKKIDEINRQQ